MKTIYLYNQNYELFSFNYENLEELKEEFLKRSINIGNRANIGDGAKIGNEANIGNRANIGYRANIGDGVQLLKSFFITGSKHAVTYTGNFTLSIGCLII